MSGGAAAPGSSGRARPVGPVGVHSVVGSTLRSVRFPLQPVLLACGRGALSFLSPGFLELMAALPCLPVVLRCGDIATVDRPNA